MKKRLLALLLVVTMLASSALAVTHKSEIVYERPNLGHLKKLINQMEETLKVDDALNRVIYLYNEMQIEYERIYTMHSLATLMQYQRADLPRYADECAACYSVLIDAHELMRAATVTLCSSDYEEDIREMWGDEAVDSLLATDPMTEEERELEGEIAKKLSEYTGLLSNPSALIDGKRVMLSDEKNLDRRNEIYSLWQREMGEIYVEIVSMRKQLADGENFLAQRYKEYYRDYSLQNARDLGEMVATALSEVYDKVGRVFDSSVVDRIDLEMGMMDAVELTAPVLATVDQSLVDSYNVMKENELYDVEYEDYKANMGFNVILPSYETPFLYVQPDGHAYGLTSFYHEFGHFNQILQSDMHHYWPGGIIDLDAMEVASQALPLMIGDALGEYLGEETATMLQRYSVNQTLFALISACAVDEFEQFVYSTDNLTVDLLNEKFGELMKKYYVPWSATTWTQINHIFESPGYYVSYAVSAITAMEIWEQFESDSAKGRESYLKAVESCDEGYRTMLATAKLRNPFSAPELLEKIRALCETEFALLVDTYGHWAEVDIDFLAGGGVINGYLGKDGKNYFRPNQNVTRAEFVKLLYSLGGDEAEYTEPFADVSDSDWFAPYVAWASANGLVNGMDATHFNPSGTITRQDMAVMLERFLTFKKKQLPAKEGAEFSDDGQISEYARFAVTRLREAEILNGLPDGRFDPRGSVTRAAAATALSTTLDVAAKTTEESADTTEQYAPIALAPIPMRAAMIR